MFPLWLCRTRAQSLANLSLHNSGGSDCTGSPEQSRSVVGEEVIPVYADSNRERLNIEEE